MRLHRRHLAVSLLWLASLGCFREEAPLTTERAPPDAGPRDAPSTPDAPSLAVGSIRILDARGVEHVLEVAPRRPTVVIEAEGAPGGDPEPAMLLRDPPDDELTADLEALPLRAATLDRAVDAIVTRAGSEIRLVPRQTLVPGARYTVALGAWAADAREVRVAGAMVVELRVSDDPAAGAAAVESWPPDGAAGVPAELAVAAIRFDGRVDAIAEGIELIQLGGAPVSATPREVPCHAIGWSAGTCIALAPDAPLVPGATYELRARPPLCDALGALLDPWAAAFVVAATSDERAPHWLAPACAVDEVAAAFGCVLADDTSVSVRVRVDEPARLALETDAGRSVAVASRGEATLRLAGLGPSRRVSGRLVATDLAGLETRAAVALATTERLAPVSIVEIRADPRGAEPRQEYVEVLNSADVPWDLDGFAIADRADAPGDVITRPAPIPARARALIVADAFDPADPADDPAPPGVVLIRIGTSIAGGGLSNAGEALFLRDPAGRRVSTAPALPSRTGVCLVRIAADGRDGAAEAFVYDEAGGCTPGTATELP